MVLGTIFLLSVLFHLQLVLAPLFEQPNVVRNLTNTVVHSPNSDRIYDGCYYFSYCQQQQFSRPHFIASSVVLSNSLQ